MPSENEKILQALKQNKKTGTENQQITEKYINSQPVLNEFIGQDSDQVYGRASVAMQKFLAGRGGGISQAVSSILKPIGGTTYTRYQADHAQQDTANWLYDQIQGLLVRHNNELTVKQVKDFLSTKSLYDGGPKINPMDLPSIRVLDDASPLNDEQIRALFQALSKELMDVADTGQAAEINIEELQRILNSLSPADQATFLSEYTTLLSTP